MDETKVYNTKELREKLIENTLRDVKEILEERGYNPYNQIVGYLMSGDPGYISSHKEARKKLLEYERAEVLEVLVRNYLKWDI